MEITYIFFLAAIFRTIVNAVNHRRPAITTLFDRTPQSLCSTCAYAHIAHGFDDRQKLMACTYGGSVRPLKFAVSECTLFCNRNANSQTVRITGFARPGELAIELIAANAD